ncbi:glycosyltransferase family 2 protein [Sphingomonas edaphi]|uniref:Glycosyltransferase family 2 protein n=1 Tax=Sphingomonas edaphi TaxID=2315689 RepID=A0A418PYF0_9SPHN|nr:glycosyltransferase family 2 protein [Sphingomonas edaphi]RIX27015.1 glycosyltransferase family 2 protein [Sphingomonas edaphi]
MTSLPPVSIGIPIYNCAPYLEDAIRSVLAQTHQDWELILVDDGSTDGSLEIALSIADPRVRVVSDGQNLGLAARLNQIAQLAGHDLVARMDADDLMHPDRLRLQIALLSANPDADIVGTGTFSVKRDGSLIGVRVPDKAFPSLEDAVTGNAGLIHASVIYRKRWALRNPYDPSIRRSEDIDLWARAAARRDLNSITIAEPLYIYREDLNVTREKLLAAYSTELACIRRHVRSPLSLAKHFLRNIAKRLVVILFFGPWLQRQLLQRRNPTPVTSCMAERFFEAMETIKFTPIPLNKSVN